MEFKYEDYFNSNDMLSVSKEDVDLILRGIDPIQKYYKGNSVEEINKLMENDKKSFSGINQAILYIKSNSAITLFDQSKVIETLRNVVGADINIIYGVGLDDNMVGLSVIIVGSKENV